MTGRNCKRLFNSYLKKDVQSIFFAQKKYNRYKLTFNV
jgi:hypothetical protein